jgi:hypothetical protein
MLESWAWRELLRHKVAYLIVMRVIVEYLKHAGQDNGRLVVTYEDLMNDCGIGRRHIPEGLDIAEALGCLVIHRSRKSRRNQKPPNRYALPFYPIAEEFETNPWNRIKSAEQARAIVQRVKEARAEEEARRKAERKVVSPSIAPEGEGNDEDGTAEKIRTGT